MQRQPPPRGAQLPPDGDYPAQRSAADLLHSRQYPGAVVFGQFTGYLSQYLITVSSAEFAYRIIGLVMIVNASIVIALQYLLSRGMRQENMLRWLALGTLFSSSGCSAL